MSGRIEKRESVWQALVQNAQKGEPYQVKFFDDPRVYAGIPVARPGGAGRSDDEFRFDVTAPTEDPGRVYRIDRIEWLERLR